MKKKLVKTVNDVNKFLKNYLAKQKKNKLTARCLSPRCRARTD